MAVTLLSGGLDSSTLLYEMVHQYPHERHYALHVLYGQRHIRECVAAGKIAQAAGVIFVEVDDFAFNQAVRGKSALTDGGPVPQGHYADENMKQTVVPFRNLHLLTLAAAFACGREAQRVAIAAHAGDHAIYPDCRPDFLSAAQLALNRAHYEPVRIEAPFLHLSKADILLRALTLDVPLADTWTCYEGGSEPCGKCGACVERAEAFALCGATDPLLRGA